MSYAFRPWILLTSPAISFIFAFSKSLAALVIHRDPTDHVQKVALLGRDDVVVCFPAHPASNVGQFRIELTGLVCLELPGNVGFRTVSVPSAGKSGWPGSANRSLPSTSMIGWELPVSRKPSPTATALYNSAVTIQCGLRMRRITAPDNLSLHDRVWTCSAP